MKEVPVKSVKKALDLLSIIAFEDIDRNGFELTVLAERLGMPVNTAHNLLKSMAACGYIAQNAKSRYIAGWKCRRMRHDNLMRDEKVRNLLQIKLKKLSSVINEALVLTLLVNGKRMPVMRMQPDGQAIRVDESVVENKSMYSFPTGKILAAFASEQQLEEVISENGVWADSDKEKAAIMKQGFAEDTEKNSIYALAFPVFSSDGDLLGSLGCYAPAFRCDREQQQLIAAEMKKSIAEITNILAD